MPSGILARVTSGYAVDAKAAVPRSKGGKAVPRATTRPGPMISGEAAVKVRQMVWRITKRLLNVLQSVSQPIRRFSSTYVQSCAAATSLQRSRNRSCSANGSSIHCIDYGFQLRGPSSSCACGRSGGFCSHGSPLQFTRCVLPRSEGWRRCPCTSRGRRARRTRPTVQVERQLRALNYPEKQGALRPPGSLLGVKRQNSAADRAAASFEYINSVAANLRHRERCGSPDEARLGGGVRYG
jgi:hypothetical protein